ncbi:MAG TPA: type II secretion system F family protein, partial [Lacipirellulaceae bacterium]|nr:type II secretion system F family protein [Lacipirellulaceae bacterium]
MSATVWSATRAIASQQTGDGGSLRYEDIAGLHESSNCATPRRRGRVRRQDLADITAQLAIMIKSGVDLASALASLANQCERPQLAEVLCDVRDLVVGGNTLSDSMRQHADVFDGAYVATIAAAEASGRMAEVLQQLAELQRGELRLRRSIQSMATYPVLLTAISTGVVA